MNFIFIMNLVKVLVIFGIIVSSTLADPGDDYRLMVLADSFDFAYVCKDSYIADSVFMQTHISTDSPYPNRIYSREVDWTNASSKMLHTSQSVPF